MSSRSGVLPREPHHRGRRRGDDRAALDLCLRTEPARIIVMVRAGHGHDRVGVPQKQDESAPRGSTSYVRPAWFRRSWTAPDDCRRRALLDPARTPGRAAVAVGGQSPCHGAIAALRASWAVWGLAAWNPTARERRRRWVGPSTRSPGPPRPTAPTPEVSPAGGVPQISHAEVLAGVSLIDCHRASLPRLGQDLAGTDGRAGRSGVG